MQALRDAINQLRPPEVTVTVADGFDTAVRVNRYIEASSDTVEIELLQVDDTGVMQPTGQKVEASEDALLQALLAVLMEPFNEQSRRTH